MGNDEAFGERWFGVFDQVGEWDGRGVGRDQRAGVPRRVDASEKIALDREVLDHRLNDPVRIGESVQVGLDVAGSDELRPARMHEAARAELTLHADLGETGFVEQQHRQGRVGELGGDPSTHQPGAEHRCGLHGLDHGFILLSR